MQELDGSIQNVEAKIHHTEATLKDLRKLQDQIATKTVERSTLFKEQQKWYAALAEENEDTDEELKEWKTEFEKRIARLESQISKLEREMNDTETKT
ncbi:DNA repair protein RAD50 [Fagus crenata]